MEVLGAFYIIEQMDWSLEQLFLGALVMVICAGLLAVFLKNH